MPYSCYKYVTLLLYSPYSIAKAEEIYSHFQILFINLSLFIAHNMHLQCEYKYECDYNEYECEYEREHEHTIYNPRITKSRSRIPS